MTSCLEWSVWWQSTTSSRTSVMVVGSGLMNKNNVTLLQEAGYKYILGVRIRSGCTSVKQWILSLEKTDNAIYNYKRENGETYRQLFIFGSCAIDDDGSLIYRTGLGHGDAMHVGDLMPDRPGLEVMMVHEEQTALYGIEMHDALTGEDISGQFTGTDVGRGGCADVDDKKYFLGAVFNRKSCTFAEKMELS